MLNKNAVAKPLNSDTPDNKMERGKTIDCVLHLQYSVRKPNGGFVTHNNRRSLRASCAQRIFFKKGHRFEYPLRSPEENPPHLNSYLPSSNLSLSLD